MQPSHDVPVTRLGVGTTSAMGLPNRVISTGRFVRSTRLTTAQHEALSFETGIDFMWANGDRSGRSQGRSRGDASPCVRDFTPAHGTDVACFECRDRRGLAIECEELDLEGLAAPVNVHDYAHVPGLEAELGERFRENDLLMFADHDRAAEIGCAVINLGMSIPFSTIQTVRTRGVRPEGVSSGPSTLYRMPQGDSTAEATRCVAPCRHNAFARTCHSAAANPKRWKNAAFPRPRTALSR